MISCSQSRTQVDWASTLRLLILWVMIDTWTMFVKYLCSKFSPPGVKSYVSLRWSCMTLTSTPTMTNRQRTGVTGLVRRKRYTRIVTLASYLCNVHLGEGDKVHLRGYNRGGHPSGIGYFKWLRKTFASICLTPIIFQVALEKLKLEQVSWKDFYLSSLLLFGSIHPWTFLLTPGRYWRDGEWL